MDDALFEQAYQAFITANNGGERHRLQAAMAVIQPRLEAAEKMREAIGQMIATKIYKNTMGKTDAYEKMREQAWEGLRMVFNAWDVAVREDKL